MRTVDYQHTHHRHDKEHSVDYRVMRIRGVKTAYLDEGSAAAQPIVLLHDGSPGSDARSCWAPLIPLLAEKYRVIAPDMTGSGRSEKLIHLDTDFYSHMIGQVAGLCDALALAPPALVGASLGGGMVLQSMARGAFSILCGTSIAGPGGRYMNPEGLLPISNYEPTEEATLAVERTLVKEPSEAAVRARLESALSDGYLPSYRARRIHGPGILPEPSDPDIHPHTAMIRRITRPTLLVAGGQDPLVDPQWAVEMAKEITGASVFTVQDGLHLPHVDNAAEVAARLDEHIGHAMAKRV
ncbi:MAG: alpha/beta fold hydrolase [Cryobacterium sp.]|nr:alpha/beta fold hydrolase [Cryobacterium sp.]